MSRLEEGELKGRRAFGRGRENKDKKRIVEMAAESINTRRKRVGCLLLVHCDRILVPQHLSP